MLELPDHPILPRAVARQLRDDYERFATGLPADPAAYFLDRYGVDITSHYAGRPVRSPFGKASGQLSLNIRQVQRDAEAGLGFVVLKTVIAQDESGTQMMHEWAIRETHMTVERIVGPRTGAEGWTITWKGRGWWDTFEAYLDLFRDALAVQDETGMLTVPSVKYHLPTPDEPGFKESEYRYTTRALQKVWNASQSGPMPLEKDFSPTLAGDDRSRLKDQILVWLRRVPGLIQSGAEGPVCLGLKIMNAVFEDDFQLAMLRAAVEESDPQPDFLVYANRLFDPAKEFEGKVGVAYGGPDLSRRNLAVLEAALGMDLPPISATGDIVDGKMAVRYGLRGCTTFQMHTLFQLPDSEFAGTMPNKTEKVLHHLYLEPNRGLVPWTVHLKGVMGVEVVRMGHLPTYGR